MSWRQSSWEIHRDPHDTSNLHFDLARHVSIPFRPVMHCCSYIIKEIPSRAPPVRPPSRAGHSPPIAQISSVPSRRRSPRFSSAARLLPLPSTSHPHSPSHSPCFPERPCLSAPLLTAPHDLANGPDQEGVRIERASLRLLLLLLLLRLQHGLARA